MHENIDINRFPRQRDVGKEVEVSFDYNPDATISGVIVRSDIDAPYKTIIQLVDGRYVLSTECAFTVPDED